MSEWPPMDFHVLDVTRLIEREGWDCGKCGHRHSGRSLGYICIGCPCDAQPVSVAAVREDVDEPVVPPRA